MWWRSVTSLHNGTALNGLRAHTTGSNAGLSAVPQPCHVRAASVAGAVRSWPGVEDRPTDATPADPFGLRAANGDGPTTSRSAPAALSMALDTSRDFGNPLFPVAKISPLRRAMNAPCGTVMHHTTPA